MKIIVITFIIIIIFILPSTVYAQQATLALSPSTGTFNKGCTFSLKIDLNTGGAQTDGTDAIVLYDPSRFTANSITSGTIYPDYPGNNIDAQAGKITVSGLASVATPFSGQGTLATVNFTVTATAPAGSSQIRFDFDPNDKAKTTDSNVVERGTVVDILNSVTDGTYTIGSGACGTTGTPAPGVYYTPGTGSTGTPSATFQPYPTPLPNTGTAEVTFILAVAGSILTILGILGLALL